MGEKGQRIYGNAWNHHSCRTQRERRGHCRRRAGDHGSTTSALLLDGADLALEAYNINGNNYFKLRDLGSALNFGVDWDGAANTVVIDTAKGYTP